MEHEPRTLKVVTKTENNILKVEINDTGKGIEKEKIKNIFDPLVTSKVYGPGLGLTFALKIIQDHQGSIQVESEPEHGTRFTINFPLK